MKKTFLLLSLLIASLTGCSNPFEETSSGSSVINTNVTTSDTSAVTTYNQVVDVYKTSAATESGTVEEAVAKAYSTVVVVKAEYTNSSSYSTGSGVLYGASEDGTTSYIVTCFHVIEDATIFSVTLSDGQEYAASLVGGDDETDLAVLAISAGNLNYTTVVENSDDIKLGSTAIAIGNPLGILANSVTCGIVSATKREITQSDGTVRELIQTDAAINSGNSGGGLFDINGNLIGIVNAKYSATGVEGLGFAIPSNTVTEIAEQLIENHYVAGRYKLGLTISDGIYRTGGFWGNSYNVVYVSDVESDGCAYGLIEEEDILSSITIDIDDDNTQDYVMTSMTSASDVNDFIESANLKIGDSITFEICRDGYNSATISVEIVLKQYKYTVD